MSSRDSTYEEIGQIYTHHHGWLLGWLTSYVRCSEQAADLAQDTFVRLMLRSEVTAVQNPRALLTTVAKGLAIDRWRRGALEQAYLESLALLSEPCTPSMEQQSLTLELLEKIATMLEGLKPKARQAFLLSQVEGMTQQKIAEHLQISKRTAQRYIADALYHCYKLRYGDSDLS